MGMQRDDLLLQLETRRHFFNRCGLGLGRLGLISLLTDGKIFADESGHKAKDFPARAKNLIYLFLAGVPS